MYILKFPARRTANKLFGKLAKQLNFDLKRS